jgi:hypothetical protein
MRANVLRRLGLALALAAWGMDPATAQARGAAAGLPVVASAAAQQDGARASEAPATGQATEEGTSGTSAPAGESVTGAAAGEGASRPSAPADPTVPPGEAAAGAAGDPTSLPGGAAANAPTDSTSRPGEAATGASADSTSPPGGAVAGATTDLTNPLGEGAAGDSRLPGAASGAATGGPLPEPAPATAALEGTGTGVAGPVVAPATAAGNVVGPADAAGSDGTSLDHLVAPPAATAPSLGRVLYADDFANPNSGWPREASDSRTRRVGYGAGEYYVARLVGSGGSPYVTRAERYADFQVEMDARLVEPTDDGYVLLDFRRQDNGDHYAFAVAPDDGAFTLRRNTERDGTTIVGWTRNPAIQTGTAWNHLAVRAQGSEIVLLVNGQEVGRAEDTSLREGSLGFGVGHFADRPAEARFRNLIVVGLD